MTCQIRTHKECSCEPQECRAIYIGTFTKDRASEAIQNTFPASHLMILVTVMMAVTVGSFASFNAYEGYKARVNQESIRND